MNTCLNKVLFILTLKDNSGQSVNVTFNFVSIHHAPVRTIFQNILLLRASTQMEVMHLSAENENYAFQVMVRYLKV